VLQVDSGGTGLEYVSQFAWSQVSKAGATFTDVGADPAGSSVVVQGNLDAHTGNTSNPHTVTATQVGKATAQWNADKIQGVTVDDTDKADNKVLQ
jgi:hypothetical protein